MKPLQTVQLSTMNDDIEDHLKVSKNRIRLPS